MAVGDAVRREVIRRADDRCEYCRLSISAQVPPPHVDHVRAKKHRVTDDAANLALSCDRCNLHKAADLTGIDPQTDEVTPLFDPRRMTWHDHFAAVGGEVVGRTPEGRTTAELLRMNEECRLALRAGLAEAGEWP